MTHGAEGDALITRARQPGRRVIVAVVAVGLLYAAVMAVLVLVRSAAPIATQPESVIYAIGNLGGQERGAVAVADMLKKHQFAALLALGNLAPPDGSPSAYQRAYRPVFGAFDDRVRPTPGELEKGISSGYDGYFSAHAPGYKGTPYYFFSISGWRIFSLDSREAATPDSSMYVWLRDNLAATTEACVAAYWHDSGTGAREATSSASPMRYVWDLLSAYHADVVLSADANLYRRYTVRDGMSAFVVGTGGLASSASPSSSADAPTGTAATARADGALELTLRSGSADFAFRGTDDRSLDAGRVDCHGRQPAPDGRPSAPTALSARPGPTGVALSWRPSAGGTSAIGYVVLRGGSRLTFTTATTYVDTTLPKGASVLYTIRAIDRAGNASAPSSPAHSGGSAPGYTDYEWAAGGINPASPTADKPQSKLWWNAGSWWGLLWDRDPKSPSRSAFFIHRFDATLQSWTNTGVEVDDRNRAHADVLWDPTSSNLYVGSTIGSGSAKLFRFSWANDSYTADPGFPVRLTDNGSESITIGKDSKGILWATLSQLPDGAGPCVKPKPCAVRIMHTTTADWRWTAPVVLPFPQATAQHDDISTLVAFGGRSIGVAWSNQLDGGIYFAIHADGASASAWTLETVSKRVLGADDHLNIKTDGTGRIYLVTKTSFTDVNRARPKVNPKDPLVILWIRQPTGQWSGSTVWEVRDAATRPQVLVDASAGRVYVVASSPDDGGAIYMKSAPVAHPVFSAGLGSVLMAVGKINNATTTKQTVRLADGILILASDTVAHTYWHAYLTPTTVPP